MIALFTVLLLPYIKCRYLVKENDLASDFTDTLPELTTKPRTEFHLLGKDVQENESLTQAVAHYLMQFGYLKKITEVNTVTINDADFRDALSRYQRLFGLLETGTVTEETLRKMSKARCGIKDKDSQNGTRNKRYIIKRKLWRRKKLRYWFNPNKYSTRLPVDVQRSEFVKSLRIWSDVADVTFVEVRSARKADIDISFESGDHGDKYPFDGQGGVLAHAYFPRKGTLHFNAEENFTTDLKKGIDFHSIATHEIGHILGIDHSFLENTIMYPYYAGREVVLHDDDKAAAAAVMGEGRGTVIPLTDLDKNSWFN